MLQLPTATTETQPALVEELSAGLVDAGEAYRKVRAYLQDGGDEEVEAIYRSLRSLVWNFVASRESGSHLDQWADAILRIRQLLRVRAIPAAEKFTVLSDMLQQSARFPLYNRTPELRSKKHVMDILKVLVAGNGTTTRAAIAEETKLRDANLSRVLANLAAAGWVSRTPNGREVIVSLTKEGAAQAKEALPPSAGKENTKDILADEFSSEILRELWPTRACALAISDEAKGIFRYSERFLAMLGPAGLQMDRITEDLRKDTAVSGRMSGRVELPTGDGRFVQIMEQRGKGRSLWLAWDVTSYRTEIEEHRRRERLLQSQISELRQHAGKQAIARTPAKSIDASAILGMLTMFRNDLLAPASLIESTARAIAAGVMGPIPHAYGDYLIGITRETSKLHGLLRNILDTGEVWDTEAITPQDDFMPAELITDIVGSLRSTSHGVKLTTNTGNIGDLKVKANERALRTALFQAISGMVELTPSGSKIDVMTKTWAGAIEVAIRAAVVDSDAVFFSSTPTQTLAMCKGMVQHFGGKFSFANTATEGCTAMILWPAETKTSRS